MRDGYDELRKYFIDESELTKIDITSIVSAFNSGFFMDYYPMNLVAPFEQFLITWFVPKDDSRRGYRAECRVFCVDTGNVEKVGEHKIDWRWALTVYMSASFLGDALKERGRFNVVLGEDGVMLGNIEAVVEDSIPDDTFAAIGNMILSSIALMNVKNIMLVDKPVSRQVRRKHERKGIPLPQYKILTLTPLKNKTQNKSDSTEKNEPLRALHIARGHFRTYTDDAPLFGKITGTFWIPAHMRGSKDNGEVIKDYNLSGRAN